jgi:hypothetical protein
MFRHPLFVALRPYLDTAVTISAAKKAPMPGVLLALTSTGYTVQGLHYREWFFFHDLMTGQDVLTGDAVQAVMHTKRRCGTQPLHSA